MARRLPGLPPYVTSVYRVGDVLVDSGCSSGRAAFARWLRRCEPRFVLTTHEHEDHIGNHAILPAAAQVWAPALAARFLREGHPRFPLYRRVVWGYHERAAHLAISLISRRQDAKAPREGDLASWRLGDERSVQPDKLDAGGRAFRVIPTDGHSVDHVAYLDERENALFSGDAYMGKFRAARLEEDLHTELASLRRMAELDPATLYPVHGPVLPRPRARLLDTVEHFEALWRRAWPMRERGVPMRRIARELLGGPAALTLISGGEFSETKLIANLLRRGL